MGNEMGNRNFNASQEEDQKAADSNEDGLKSVNQVVSPAETKNLWEECTASADNDTTGSKNLLIEKQPSNPKEEGARNSAVITASRTGEVPIESVNMMFNEQDCPGLSGTEPPDEDTNKRQGSDGEGVEGFDEEVDKLEDPMVMSPDEPVKLSNSDFANIGKGMLMEEILVHNEIATDERNGEQINKGNGVPEHDYLDLAANGSMELHMEGVPSTDRMESFYLEALGFEIKRVLMENDSEAVEKPSNTIWNENEKSSNFIHHKGENCTPEEDLKIDGTGNSKTDITFVSPNFEMKRKREENESGDSVIERSFQTDEMNETTNGYRTECNHNPSLISRDYNRDSEEEMAAGIANCETEVMIAEAISEDGEESSDDQHNKSKLLEINEIKGDTINATSFIVSDTVETEVYNEIRKKSEASDVDANNLKERNEQTNGELDDHLTEQTVSADLIAKELFVHVNLGEVAEQIYRSDLFEPKSLTRQGSVSPSRHLGLNQKDVIVKYETVEGNERFNIYSGLRNSTISDIVVSETPTFTSENYDPTIETPPSAFKFEDEKYLQDENGTILHQTMSQTTEILAFISDSDPKACAVIHDNLGKSSSFSSEEQNPSANTLSSTLLLKNDKEILVRDHTLCQETEDSTSKNSDLLVKSSCEHEEEELKFILIDHEDSHVKLEKSEGNASQTSQERLHLEIAETVTDADNFERSVTLPVQLQKENSDQIPSPNASNAGGGLISASERSGFDIQKKSVKFMTAPEVRNEEAERIPFSYQEKSTIDDVFSFKDSVPENEETMGRPLLEVISKVTTKSELSTHERGKEKPSQISSPYREPSRESAVSSLGSDSGRLRTPLLSLLKEEVHVAESLEKQEELVMKKPVDEAWKSPAKKSMVRKKQRPRSSLLSNCMCCTTVIQ